MPRFSRSAVERTISKPKEAGREPEVVQISLLGGFWVSVGSRVIEEDEWRLRKGASLVKLLALEPGHRMHREQAMELLWPGLDRKAAANNLHQALHFARRALEPEAAAASSHLLRLHDELLELCANNALWVDVEAFEAAAATARAQLGEAAFAADWAMGRAMWQEGAIEYALEAGEPQTAAPVVGEPPVGRHPAALTPREREVAVLVARGLTDRSLTSFRSPRRRSTTTSARSSENWAFVRAPRSPPG
jgi:hypothetical protein